ncbi:siderophore-interacting protein, partial [Vibrio parahaemolyticus V-223/04]
HVGQWPRKKATRSASWGRVVSPT